MMALPFFIGAGAVYLALKDQKAAELQFAEEAQQAKAELMRKDLLLGKTTHHASELEKTLEKEVAGAKKAKEAEKLLKESKDTLEKQLGDLKKSASESSAASSFSRWAFCFACRRWSLPRRR